MRIAPHHSARRSNGGFTMMEMLIVVAIIVILGGIGTLSLFSTQKNLYQLQMDGTAKEIYIAAQNHLTTAQAEGTLAVVTPGTEDTAEDDVYYFVYGGTTDASTYYKNRGNALAQMLPFGAVDDTVRISGSYVVRYQLKGGVARVLDVFYADPSGSGTGFGGRFATSFSAGDYSSLVSNYKGDGNSEARRSFKGQGIIGWWGDEAAGAVTPDFGTLLPPAVQVENAERLRVIVTDTNAASAAGWSNLRLEVRGVTSGAVMAIPLKTISAIGGVPSYGECDFRDLTTSAAAQEYVIDLDDVTSTGNFYKTGIASGHFADVAAHYLDTLTLKTFIPGEDVEIVAIADSTTRFASPAQSTTVIANSLFDSVAGVSPSEGEAATHQAAIISSIRHLENLGTAISGYNQDTLTAAQKNAAALTTASAVAGQGTLSGQGLTSSQLAAAAAGDASGVLDITGAVQVCDLSWNNFRYALLDVSFDEATGVLGALAGDTAGTTGTKLTPQQIASWCQQYAGSIRVDTVGAAAVSDAGTFMPVVASSTTDAGYALNYDGSTFYVSDVVVRTAGEAGLFGTLSGGSVQNLGLVNFDVASTGGAAGALAGAATDAAIEGVLVFNRAEDRPSGTDADLEIAGATGVGGLVGSVSGGSVTTSAAAVYVSSTGEAAGGLVGNANATNISSSYAGGHTKGGSYSESTTSGEAARVNVQGVSNAGGLVGSASATTIASCYSTCSASGGVAGGLAGTLAGGSVSNSYATGRVLGMYAGAFAGAYSGTSFADDTYLSIINDTPADVGTPSTSMPAVNAEDDGTSGISAADEDTSAYNAFATGTGSAVCYDSVLASRYSGTYPFRSIASLAGISVDVLRHVATHYGDWPSPETMVVNVR